MAGEGLGCAPCMSLLSRMPFPFALPRMLHIPHPPTIACLSFLCCRSFPVTSIHEVSSIIDPTTAGDAPH
jgi:hypothetical protein